MPSSDLTPCPPGLGSIRRIGLDFTPPKFTLVSDDGLEIFESRTQFTLVVKVEEDFSGVAPGQQSSQFKAELINPLGQSTLLQPTFASGPTSKLLNASFIVGGILRDVAYQIILW